MANQYVNKVVVNGATKIDLTGDTVTASDVLKGKTAHDRTGAPIIGTCEFDSDTSDATATASEILTSKTAYIAGAKVTGTMPNKAGEGGTISTKAQQITIATGYHDGSGKVQIDSTEQAKIIATNIRQGVTILGVEGTMSGSEDVNAQTKNVTPSFSVQQVVPDTDYNYLSQVNVAAIPATEQDNPQGGVTVTIG